MDPIEMPVPPPLPPGPEENATRHFRTPEGEVASFVHGQFRVDDRGAFKGARSNFEEAGAAFAYVVTAAGAPWTRAVFWFDDEYLRLETSHLDRYFHLEQVFEHLWPPVFRMGRIFAGVDEDLDAPFRPHYPHPPAEASGFTRLLPPSGGRLRAGDPADQASGGAHIVGRRGTARSLSHPAGASMQRGVGPERQPRRATT